MNITYTAHWNRMLDLGVIIRSEDGEVREVQYITDGMDFEDTCWGIEEVAGYQLTHIIH